jgi:hypothetical protein
MTSVLRRRIVRVARRQQELDDENSAERAHEELLELADHLGFLRPLPGPQEVWERAQRREANDKKS